MASLPVKSRSPLLNKPKMDLKDYEFVELDSGLQVILVSTERLQLENAKLQSKSKSTCTAAAALTVQVGSFCDPKECEGLAHFLEHMVFMGSEKYPQENAYDAFITSHGGSCNAFTEGEYTTYQFDVNSDHFSEALDIFAHCFIDPLLSMSTSEREINAIDNEFKLAGNDDGARLQEIYALSIADSHVVRKFSWGNKNSLQDVPASLGVDMQTTTRLFHHTHYRPQNSRLVVVSPKPLDALLTDVVSSFGSWQATAPTTPMLTLPASPSVPASTTAKASKSSQSKKKLKASAPSSALKVVTTPSITEAERPYLGKSPLAANACATITRVAMVKNVHVLYLAWAFPSTYSTYRTQPALYLSHLIGHEGAGSLLSCLKNESLATGVSAGVGFLFILVYIRTYSYFYMLMNMSVSSQMVFGIGIRQLDGQCHVLHILGEREPDCARRGKLDAGGQACIRVHRHGESKQAAALDIRRGAADRAHPI